jgi:hypothetical protein
MMMMMMKNDLKVLTSTAFFSQMGCLCRGGMNPSVQVMLSVVLKNKTFSEVNVRKMAWSGITVCLVLHFSSLFQLFVCLFV